MVKIFEPEGSDFIIKVGDNARDNDVVRRTCKQNDLWFHIQDPHSSPHVFLCAHQGQIAGAKKNKKPPQPTKDDLEMCALVLLLHCTQKQLSAVLGGAALLYTEVKNVSCTGIDGCVTVKGRPRQLKFNWMRHSDWHQEMQDMISRLGNPESCG